MSFIERVSSFFNELPFNSNNDVFKYTMFMTKHSQVFKNMNTQFTAEDFEMFKEIINKLDYSTLCNVSSNLNSFKPKQNNQYKQNFQKNNNVKHENSESKKKKNNRQRNRKKPQSNSVDNIETKKK